MGNLIYKNTDIILADSSGNLYSVLDTVKNGKAISDLKDEIQSTEVESVLFWPGSDTLSDYVKNTDDPNLYVNTVAATVEVDFTTLNNGLEYGLDALYEIFNKEYNFALRTNDVNTIENPGTIISRGKDGIEFNLEDYGSLCFLPESYLGWPHLFIDSIDITAMAWYDATTMESASTSFDIYCDDIDNIEDCAHKFYTLPAGDGTNKPNAVTFTLDRNNLKVWVEPEQEGEDGHYEDTALKPLDYISFNLASASNSQKYIIQKLVFHLVEADSEQDYKDENYYPQCLLKKVLSGDDIEADSSMHHVLHRFPNQDIYVTDYKETTGGYVLISSLDMLEDGEYLITGLNTSGTGYMLSYDGDATGVTLCVSATAGLIIPDEDYDAAYYEASEFHVTVTEGTTIHLFHNNTSKYVGYNQTGKSGILSSDNDIYVNLVSNTLVVTTVNGGVTYKLCANGSTFKFYKNYLQDIYFYKKVASNPYTWKTLVKKNEISNVGFSGKYEDLLNKPSYTIGDVQVYDAEELPIASSAYMKKLLRYDHKLYEVVNGDGVNVDPKAFAARYPSISGACPKTQLREWMTQLLLLSTNIMKDAFFENSYRISTNNTSTRGILIGSSNSDGLLEFRMTLNEIREPRFDFQSVTLTFEQYGNETTHTYIGVGQYTGSSVTILDELYVDFNYEAEKETLDSQTITIEVDERCEVLQIRTEILDEGDRGRIVLKEFMFNDFHYFISEDNENNIDFKMKNEWKPISGGGGGSIKVIDLL